MPWPPAHRPDVTASPPWSVEEYNDACIVKDAHGQALAYVYFEDEPGRRSAAKLHARKRGASPRTSPSRRGCCAGSPLWCPLSGVKRTSRLDRAVSAFDPKRTLANQDRLMENMEYRHGTDCP
jgi:hypothetical protein